MDEPTLMSALKRQVHRDPHRPVAVWGKEAPSYAEAYSLAQVLAGYFAGNAALKEGDAVLVSSPSTMGHFCAVAAVQACGARTVLAQPGMPQEALRRLLEEQRPSIALVADQPACACVRETLPRAEVFSMGAAEVDAPSMGYMADQAIGLVDEVFLLVNDMVFDEQRDVEVLIADADGSTSLVLGSQIARDARRLVEEKGLADGAQVHISAPFSTYAGLMRVHAALSVGGTIDLGA